MDAYQYFFDGNGDQTGYQRVGEIHFHEANHQHWHFEDFARYRLLNEDMTLAVRSTKASFCLANTDAVDYTVPSADWKPENTDLSSACGGAGALSLREVLSAGSGDTYLQYRAGQAFRIGSLPDGDYYIRRGEPGRNTGGRNLVEGDNDNNDSLRKISIGTDKRTVSAGSRPRRSASSRSGCPTSSDPPARPAARRTRAPSPAGDGTLVVRRGGAQPLRSVIFSVAAGRTACRSPTTPKSTSSKIGASSSLLTATIVFEVCMPARCWIAPEMPAAT